MRRAHHYDSSIIHLVQNVFDKDLSHRTISLNATYIALFKNPRDMSQVSHLDKQVYPGGNGLLTAAYRDATSSRAHSYVVIDFNQSTLENFHLRNTLFPDDEFPEAFAHGPASQAWKKGSHCRGGPPPSPTMGPCSGQPGTSAAWLLTPYRRRPRPPARRRRLRQDLCRHFDMILCLSGGRRSHKPKTQQRAIVSWSSPWPSTNGVCSRSWAWPGWRPSPSGTNVAWR